MSVLCSGLERGQVGGKECGADRRPLDRGSGDVAGARAPDLILARRPSRGGETLLHFSEGEWFQNSGILRF